jgi:hypothetical protein
VRTINVRKKNKGLNMNKYMAMGPRGSDVRSERAGWLPAVKLLLLLNEFSCGIFAGQ